jgi:hypothetical protein
MLVFPFFNYNKKIGCKKKSLFALQYCVRVRVRVRVRVCIHPFIVHISAIPIHDYQEGILVYSSTNVRYNGSGKHANKKIKC